MGAFHQGGALGGRGVGGGRAVGEGERREDGAVYVVVRDLGDACELAFGHVEPGGRGDAVGPRPLHFGVHAQYVDARGAPLVLELARLLFGGGERGHEAILGRQQLAGVEHGEVPGHRGRDELLFGGRHDIAGRVVEGALGPELRGALAEVEHRPVDGDASLIGRGVEQRQMLEVEPVQWGDDHRLLESIERPVEGDVGPAGGVGVGEVGGGVGVGGARGGERGVRGEGAVDDGLQGEPRGVLCLHREREEQGGDHDGTGGRVGVAAAAMERRTLAATWSVMRVC